MSVWVLWQESKTEYSRHTVSMNSYCQWLKTHRSLIKLCPCGISIRTSNLDGWGPLIFFSFLYCHSYAWRGSSWDPIFFVSKSNQHHLKWTFPYLHVSLAWLDVIWVHASAQHSKDLHFLCNIHSILKVGLNWPYAVASHLILLHCDCFCLHCFLAV